MIRDRGKPNASLGWGGSFVEKGRLAVHLVHPLYYNRARPVDGASFP
jgi:hypothetical protein